MRCFYLAFLLLIMAIGAWAQPKLKEFVMEPAESSGSFSNNMQSDQVVADRVSLRDLLGFAHAISPVQVLGPSWLDERFRVNAKAEAGQEGQFLGALQHALADRLHLRIEHATKEMPVYVLKAVNPKLRSGSGQPGISGGDGTVSIVNAPMSEFDKFLTQTFDRTVVDETGLNGGYTFELSWHAGDLGSLTKTIRERLGLVLVEERRTVDVLMVDRI